MPGVMPKTALLLTRHDTLVVGRFDSYSAVGHHLGITVSDEGKVKFMDRSVNPGYVIQGEGRENGFTKREAVSDWCRCYMERHLKAHGYQLYRYML